MRHLKFLCMLAGKLRFFVYEKITWDLPLIDRTYFYIRDEHYILFNDYISFG